jgi:hypothetical protein
MSELQTRPAPPEQEIDSKTRREIEEALARVAVKKKPVIIPPVYDKNGTVLRPAIDVANGTLANGQPVDGFYTRGTREAGAVKHRRLPGENESYFEDFTSPGGIALRQAEREAVERGLIEE